jgi:hypothetical protein
MWFNDMLVQMCPDKVIWELYGLMAAGTEWCIKLPHCVVDVKAILQHILDIYGKPGKDYLTWVDGRKMV